MRDLWLIEIRYPASPLEHERDWYMAVNIGAFLNERDAQQYCREREADADELEPWEYRPVKFVEAVTGGAAARIERCEIVLPEADEPAGA